MKRLASLLILSAVACSTTAPTKYNQRVMRIMVDPDSVPQSQYVRLVHALMESGKWTVVDRAQGWEAIKAEQERLHGNIQDRFDNEEKWAMWGKMYGVGGVVVAHAMCEQKGTAITHTPYLGCQQSLSLVDANTGEIVVVASGYIEGEVNQLYVPPSWEWTVDKLNSSFPKDYKAKNYSNELKSYAAEVKKAAEQKRQPASEHLLPVN